MLPAEGCQTPVLAADWPEVTRPPFLLSIHAGAVTTVDWAGLHARIVNRSACTVWFRGRSLAIRRPAGRVHPHGASLRLGSGPPRPSMTASSTRLSAQMFASLRVPSTTWGVGRASLPGIPARPEQAGSPLHPVPPAGLGIAGLGIDPQANHRPAPICGEMAAARRSVRRRHSPIG